jgi:hypothetical protein
MGVAARDRKHEPFQLGKVSSPWKTRRLWMQGGPGTHSIKKGELFARMRKSAFRVVQGMGKLSACGGLKAAKEKNEPQRSQRPERKIE